MRLLTLLLLLQFGPIDINTATKEELTSLPAVTPNIADRIIKGRPYKSVDDVQGSVPRFEFDKIRPRIYVAPSPLAMTPSPIQVTPRRVNIQTIQGNKIESLTFEKKEEAPPPVETK
jgi:Helix-hairpin-helix motif